MTETTDRLRPHPDDDAKIIYIAPSEELASIASYMTAGRMNSILDAAETGNTRELFALYRDILAGDSHIITEFTKRKSAILGETMNVIPYDKKNPEDVVAKDLCWQFVDSKTFTDAVSWLLNSVLYPVCAIEKVFAPTPGGYKVRSLIPVPFAMLDLRQDTVRIFDVMEGRIQSTSREADPDRYIIHRNHVLPVPDRWGGPMRSILFWWLLRTQDRQWLATFLEKYGSPFMVGTYKDADGQRVLERAFSLAHKLGGIVISQGTKAEFLNAASQANSDGYEKCIELCNREISRLLVGQTLSSNTDATGLGSGTAKLQGDIRDDLKKMDAQTLNATFGEQLFKQLLRYNGIAGRTPTLTFGAKGDEDVKSLLGIVKAASDANLELDDDALATFSETAGIGFRRKQSAPNPFQGLGLNATVTDGVAPSLAPHLAEAFRGRYLPVARIIRTAKTRAECEERLKAWAVSEGGGDVSDIVTQALSAYALSGINSVQKIDNK